MFHIHFAVFIIFVSLCVYVEFKNKYIQKIISQRQENIKNPIEKLHSETNDLKKKLSNLINSKNIENILFEEKSKHNENINNMKKNHTLEINTLHEKCKNEIEEMKNYIKQKIHNTHKKKMIFLVKKYIREQN